MAAERTPYEMLDVDPSATLDEIHAAYERALKLIRGDSLGGYLMLDEDKIDDAIAEVQAAYDDIVREGPDSTNRSDESVEANAEQLVSPPDTSPMGQHTNAAVEATGPSPALLRFLTPTESGEGEAVPGIKVADEVQREPSVIVDPIVPDEIEQDQHHKTELPVMATEEQVNTHALDNAAPTEIEPKDSSPSANKIPPNEIPPELLEELANGTEVSGAFVRQLREARGLSIQEVARSTHIQKRFLQAIEDVDSEALPGRVFLRGFLQQIGRALRVDKKKLSEGYLRMLDRANFQ